MADRARPEVEGAGVLDAQGPAAPPRRNGELVFEAPWQSRLFGLTMSLHRAGRFGWEEFRTRLIQEIARWERDSPPGAPWSYYERWQASFERLLEEKGLCAPADLGDRVAALAARAPGHDHRHGESED